MFWQTHCSMALREVSSMTNHIYEFSGTDCGGKEKPPVRYHGRFSPKFGYQNALHFSGTADTAFFYLLLCKRSAVAHLRGLTCFSAREWCIPFLPEKTHIPLCFCRHADHFGSLGSASCPIASRRFHTVWNWQGQKFGQTATSLTLPQRAKDRIADFPTAVNYKSYSIS